MKVKSHENVVIEIIIEKKDGLLWGRVEGRGDFMPTPTGEDTNMLIENLKELIKDYITNEGSSDSLWNNLNLVDLNVEIKYDLQAYFHEHDYLKISSVALLAGLNPGLVRQYASGVKYPSKDQVNKIRDGIKKIAEMLLEDSIYVAS